MVKVAIVDYHMGNMFSLQSICSYIGLNSAVTFDRNQITDSDAVILPGVGAFGEAMNNIAELGLLQTLKDFAASGRPFMGICLGLQLLFTESEEFGIYKGLDIIKGRVLKFPAKNTEGTKIKVPCVGWNRVYRNTDSDECMGSPLKAIKDGEFMYFVHSYYVSPSDANDVISFSCYEGIKYCSAIRKGNIFAMQFHPEKSAKNGVDIFSNWADKIKK